EGVEILRREVLGQGGHLLGTELALGVGGFPGPIPRRFDDPDFVWRRQELLSANSDCDSRLQFAILGEIVLHFARTARQGEQTGQKRCCTESETPLDNADRLHVNLVQGSGISPRDKTNEMLIRLARCCRTATHGIPNSLLALPRSSPARPAR